MSNHIGEVQRVVVCAANQCPADGRFTTKPVTVLGARHFDERMREQINNLKLAGFNPTPESWEQGFIDQYGVFMTRQEAFRVARDAGQINVRRWKTSPAHLLFSEDLY